jgi:hypothetical protein
MALIVTCFHLYTPRVRSQMRNSIKKNECRTGNRKEEFKVSCEKDEEMVARKGCLSGRHPTAESIPNLSTDGGKQAPIVIPVTNQRPHRPGP